jgi:death-on-curing family protein
MRLVPYCQNDLACAGAKLFYKIIKNHHRVDGNKRSALLVTFFFFAWNGRYIEIAPEVMYRLAAHVAADQRKSDVVERFLEEIFREHLQTLVD